MAQPKRLKVNGHHSEEEKSWSELQDRVLLEPFEYVCKIPGKKIRTKLIHVSPRAVFLAGGRVVLDVTHHLPCFSLGF